MLAVIAAWIVRFIQDDAFITYRYARNLARGEGLVFNSGERVEGYTNFLWTVWHYIPERFGWSTPVFSQVLGIALMVATVAVTIRLARRVFGSEAFALLVALTLLANMTFLTYSTGGLETMQQAFLVISAAALLLPAGRRGASNRPVSEHFLEVGTASGGVLGPTQRRVLAGACLGLAVLTRLDSSLLVTTFVLVHLAVEHRYRRQWGRTVVSAVQIALPAAIILVPWFAWKLSYYGNLLPNTFYAKAAGSRLVLIAYGLLYLAVFFFSYAAFLLIPRFRRHRRELMEIHGVRQLLVVVPVWFIYVCLVGADFMEFRFMVPLLPILAMVAAFLIDQYTRFVPHAVLIAVLLFFSATHRIMPTVIPYPVLTFTELDHWPTESKTSWKGKGELLASIFPGGPDVPGQPRIAVAPLGLLPYYADLWTVDVLGLTDPVTARSGFPIEPYYPGHVRMATVGHLIDESVSLIIAQPGSVEPNSDRSDYRLSEIVMIFPSTDLRDLPAGSKVIEVPQVDGKVWLIIYVEQNDLVDAAIEREGWAVYPIDHRCEADDLVTIDEDGAVASIANWVVRLVAKRTCPDL